MASSGTRSARFSRPGRAPQERSGSRAEAGPPLAPSLLLGLGLGGFVDGIALHQLLQWHHMLSDTASNPTSTVAGLEANTVGDGAFHLLTWVFVATGMTLAVRAWQRGELAPPWRFHAGILLAGWGIFNLVEGLIDHQILGLHHVRDDLGGPLGWDLGFLAFGVLLIAGGALLARSAPRPRAASTPRP
jgi:uncharacterized membrane protein